MCVLGQITPAYWISKLLHSKAAFLDYENVFRTIGRAPSGQIAEFVDTYQCKSDTGAGLDPTGRVYKGRPELCKSPILQ